MRLEVLAQCIRVADDSFRVRDVLQHPDADNVGDFLTELSAAAGPWAERALELLKKLVSKSITPEAAAEQIAEWAVETNKKDHITFDQAAIKARVPTDVEWKFHTQTGYGGYGDNHYSGYVVYGRSGSQHVFVGVRYVREQNFFTNRDVDYTEMWVVKYPLSNELKILAPRAIRELWGSLGRIKGYNAKVIILPPDLEFKAINHFHGSAVAFKDALALMGEIKADDPLVKDRKLAVELRLQGRIEGLKTKDGNNVFRMTFVVNGREYPLSEASCQLLSQNQYNARGFLGMIFGTYVYDSSKKVVTKAKNGKTVLTYAAEKLTAEPQELRDALKVAADQMK